MGISVRAENRWKKKLYSENDATSRKQLELESMGIERGPRQVVVPPKSAATRAQVRRWMRQNASDYQCFTTLAEGANIVLDLPEGAMDDETHWLWDESYEAMKLAENNLQD